MIAVPRPAIDVSSAPFWAAAAQRRLAMQQCNACSTFRFPPGPVCRRCGSSATSWVAVSGRGHVLSWVVTHHVLHAAFADRVPYTILLVELAEQRGLLMYGNLQPDDADVRDSMEVRVIFEDIGDGVVLPQWEPA